MPEPKKKRRKQKIEDTDAWMAAELDYIDLTTTNMMPLLRGPIVGEEKIEWLEGIVEECPEYYPALFDLASENIKNGNDEAGKRCIDRGLQSLREHFSRSDLIDAYYKTCEFLEYYLRFELALEYYNQLLGIERDKQKPEVYDRIAHCYAVLNKMDKAIEYQQRAIESGSSSKFYSNMGWLEMIRGNIEEAEKTLKKAVELDKKDDIAKTNYEICKTLIESKKMHNWDDYLLREVDYEKLNKLEEKEEWEEYEDFVVDYNQSRINAFRRHLLRNPKYSAGERYDIMFSLWYILDFVFGIYDDGYFLYDDIEVITDNFERIMHKLIFKTGDIDDEIFDGVYAAVLEFYNFLSKHKLVERDEFKELKKEMKRLKPPLREKMLRYNEVRHNDDYTEEEKEEIREELFEGDHEWPIL
ncbi:MAG: tetratricopeptide repeat protein [archaeon]|nr:tetratricopeptide repeat protein [archaeon]